MKDFTKSSPKSNLRLVPPEPKEDESYTIDSIKPDYRKTGIVLVSIRIVNTDQVFELPVQELATDKWLNKLSKWDAMQVGLYANLESKKSYDLLDKTQSVNLFQHKYILVLGFLYVTLLIVSNIVGGKLTRFFGLDFPAVLFAFPITFILGDILTEVYGYKVSRRIIWIGFFGNLVTILGVYLVGLLPASPYWTDQGAYEKIFSLSFRVSAASFAAYLGGEFMNAIILSKLKKRTNGRYLWFRIMGASAAADIFDSILFCTVGFMGVVPSVVVFKMVLTQMVFKITYELVASPLTCKVCKFIKKDESIDVFDYDVKYNPLSIK
jgi:uncharacterized integral membrane protein (TIGR00697 family)